MEANSPTKYAMGKRNRLGITDDGLYGKEEEDRSRDLYEKARRVTYGLL